MKVRSLHNSKRRQRKSVKIIVVSVVLLGIGLFLPRLFSAVSAIVFYPIHATNVWLEESSSLIPMFFRNRRSLETEITELENQLLYEKRNDATQARLVRENQRLRQLLGATEASRVAAAVIARPNELPYDYLQIDRGSDHGIEVGAPVFLGEDIVIGLVVHVARKYAFVQLITTPGFEATVFVFGPDVVATMEGYGGGVARVRVPQGVPIKKGDLVQLPSINPGVFGYISYVENEPTQPEQYGYVVPHTALSGLHYVAVGTLSQISHSASEINERILEDLKGTLVVPGITVSTTPATTDITASSSRSEN